MDDAEPEAADKRVGFDALLARLAADTDGFLAADGVRHVFKPNWCGFRCKTLGTTINISFPFETDGRGRPRTDCTKPFSVSVCNRGLHCDTYVENPLQDAPAYAHLLAVIRFCLLRVRETDLYYCTGCRRAFATYREFVAHEQHHCNVCDLPFAAMCARQYHGGREITFGRAHADGIELHGWHRGVRACLRPLAAGAYVCHDCLPTLLAPDAFFTPPTPDECRVGFDELMARLAASTNNFGGHVFVPCWRGFYCDTLRTTLEMRWPAQPNHERSPDFAAPFDVELWSPIFHSGSRDAGRPLVCSYGYERLLMWVQSCIDEGNQATPRNYGCGGMCRSDEFATYREFVAHEQHHCAACDAPFRAMCARESHGDQEIVYGEVLSFEEPRKDYAVRISLRGWFMGEYYSRRAFPVGAFVCPDCLDALRDAGAIVHQWSH